MKIAVLAYGSRGDVQPMVILGYKLALLGHEVTLAVPSNDAAVARHLVARVVAFPIDARAMLEEGDLKRSLREGRNLAFFGEGIRLEEKRRIANADVMRSACDGADVIVATPLVEDVALCIAEANRQRIALVMPMPMWSNSVYPSFFFASARLPGFLNRATFTLTELGARSLVAPVNELRVLLGLAPVKTRPALTFRDARPPVFYWLPTLVTPPPPEFGDNHHFTGYWSVPPAMRRALGESSPPAELVRFLDAGTPPIYAGFGSMPVLDEGVLAIFDRVAQRLDRRVVLGRGWSSAPLSSTERVMIIADVDHDWLLPRCVAGVHHGGASTTGACLRAGIPQVVASVFADQPFWGRRVRELGVGETFRFQKLDEARLLRALEKALHEDTRTRAKAVAVELAAQPDGAELAARIIHERGTEFPIPRLNQ